MLFVGCTNWKIAENILVFTNLIRIDNTFIEIAY